MGLTSVTPMVRSAYMPNLQDNDNNIVESCRELIAMLQNMTPREREILLADPGIHAQLVRLQQLLDEVAKEF